jgi:hypothetical protein
MGHLYLVKLIKHRHIEQNFTKQHRRLWCLMKVSFLGPVLQFFSTAVYCIHNYKSYLPQVQHGACGFFGEKPPVTSQCLWKNHLLNFQDLRLSSQICSSLAFQSFAKTMVLFYYSNVLFNFVYLRSLFPNVPVSFLLPQFNLPYI